MAIEINSGLSVTVVGITHLPMNIPSISVKMRR